MLKYCGLTEESVEAVAALERECFGGDAWSESVVRSEIDALGRRYILLFDGEELIAYAGYAQVLDEGHIMRVAVTARRRNEGLASLLLKKLMDEAARYGVERFTLEVRESNKPARKLYEKLGFVSAGIRKGYYSDKENCCIYWR